MKAFLLRIILFGALVMTLVGGVCLAAVVADVRRYHASLVAPEDGMVLLCNDSQTGNDVVPTVCPRFFNRSAHGRTLDQAYLTMTDALRVNPKGRIKTVVFDVTPGTAVAPLRTPLADMGQPAMYWLLHCLHPFENIRPMAGWPVVARNDLVGRRFRHCFKALRGKTPFRSSLEAEFPQSDVVGKTLAPDRYWALVKEKAAGCGGQNRLTLASPFAVDVLDRVIACAKANGVNLLLVTTPWNVDLREACTPAEMDAFTDIMRRYAASRSCPYADFLRLRLEEDCWRDGNHLNRRGAAVFTRLLADELTKRGWL